MAYVSQERKQQIVALAKPILKKYGVSATFGVNNHSTLVCNIRSGKLDFIGNYNETALARPSFRGEGHETVTKYMDVNPYHYRNHFTGDCKEFLEELMSALNTGNHDKSDIQTDYFDVGWYVDVNIGKWNKPYILEK
jgi:hypothetical protein